MIAQFGRATIGNPFIYGILFGSRWFDSISSHKPKTSPGRAKLMSNMDFGTAIELLKQGKMVRRAGWNGKGMFLFIRPEFVCSLEEFKGFQSVPVVVKDLIKSDLTLHNKSEVKFTSYICMGAADKTIVNGWLASQTDMLSTDWETVD